MSETGEAPRLLAECARALSALRQAAPLTHCPSASPTMPLVANVLLACGARPMMTHSEAEAPTLTPHAAALLVNLGVLAADGPQTLRACVAAAREKGLPWVLDPAAIGAAPVRTPLAFSLLQNGPALVRANASETITLAGGAGGGSGPDTTREVADAAAAARRLAKLTGAVVAVSGKQDLITDGSRTARVAHGSELLPLVTGTGCSLGALTTALAAVAEPFTAALTATLWFTRAAERAQALAAGPGTFVPHLLDALHALDADGLCRNARLEITREDA
ncbi:hydroxyethylthiazole kinase [Dermabacteraceae bacterium P13077]